MADVAVGLEHFIAANGDSLFTELIGQGYPTENPDVTLVVNAHSITGGTGRFAGATGGFISQRLVNQVTLKTTGWLKGTISVPGDEDREHERGRGDR